MHVKDHQAAAMITFQLISLVVFYVLDNINWLQQPTTSKSFRLFLFFSIINLPVNASKRNNCFKPQHYEAGRPTTAALTFVTLTEELSSLNS